MPSSLESTANTASMLTHYGVGDDFTTASVTILLKETFPVQPIFISPACTLAGILRSTRYEMMLRLMRDHSKMFIVPTYAMDVIWHTHLPRFPMSVPCDCQKIAGRAIQHGDDVGHDRSPAGLLFANAAKTEQIWRASFGSTWRKEGAMHRRGEPPPWLWEDRARAPAGPSPPGTGSQARDLFAKYIVRVAGRALGALPEEVGPWDIILHIIP
jgi:hypothetical protein